MAAQLSALEKKIRSNASEEKRSIDDFDRFLRELGLFDILSKLNLSFGPSKLGLDLANFFRLDDTREIDKRLKAAFKFCGLSEEDPRHWRALLNALVTECFPKKGRSITRDQASLFELLLDIHALQANSPKLMKAEDIAKKLLRDRRFSKKYPTINSVGSLTKLVRKAQIQNIILMRGTAKKKISLYMSRVSSIARLELAKRRSKGVCDRCLRSQWPWETSERKRTF
jgi:hypothetical protein